jgi:hypothetical protein
MQAVAYLGAFTPASVGTNYAADAGFNSIINPGLSSVFSVNVPSGATLNVVVTELKSPGNGFPSALGGTYTLKVAGLPVTAGPTAALVGVSGRVLANGQGVGNSKVTLTGEDGKTMSYLTAGFGYFHFDGVESGKTYILQADHKRYSFTPKVLSVDDNLTDVDFVLK